MLDQVWAVPTGMFSIQVGLGALGAMVSAVPTWNTLLPSVADGHSVPMKFVAGYNNV